MALIPQNKYLNIALGLAAAAVWVHVFWKYFGTEDQGPAAAGPDLLVDDHKGPPPELRAFSLGLDYPDPFLGKEYRPKRAASPAPTVRPQASGGGRARQPEPEKPKVQAPQWPKLAYHGFVRQAEAGGAQSALLSSDGRLHSVSGGDQVGRVRVVAIYADSIHLAMNELDTTITMR